jgi:xylan 1,4-beta-xylosidase
MAPGPERRAWLFFIVLGTTLAAQNANAPRVVEPSVTEPHIDAKRDLARPAIVLVGDASVKDHGPAEGWGDYLAPFVDERVQVLNRATEGESSRSFIEQGRWLRTLADIRQGDYVLIGFGTGARDADAPFLAQYVRDARAKGATPVVVSPAPVPSAPFLDLTSRLDQIYRTLGEQESRRRYFMTGDSARTNAAGALAAATAVADGLRSIADPTLPSYLRPTAAALASIKPPEWARGIEGQRKGDLGNGFYLNPIVAGDHPDPSILKDGNDYYLTFSSFDAYPGLVIWHSRDAINWQPIGSALFRNVGSVWAPDLVKHGNRYYIYFPGIGPTYRSNYVIWADNIRGPWSEPIDLKISRIDPGHAVAPDGTRYLFLSAGYLVQLTRDGLATVGEQKKVYDGWKYPVDWIVEGFAQEGPKVFKKGDYYYQVLAEGGTAGPPTSHMIVSARAKNIEGPWESSPYNPIVRTQSPDEYWWSKGHGTVFEGPDHRWWIIYHAYENGFATLGRQTLLEPIEWLDDGWFRSAGYDSGRPIPKPSPAGSGAHGFAFSDDFSSSRLGVQWSFYNGSADDQRRVRIKDGTLALAAKGTSPADSSPLSFVVGDQAYEVEVEIDADGDATAGLLLFYNRRLYAGLGFSAKNFIMHSYGLDRPGGKPSQLGQHLWLRLRNDRHIVTIHYSTDGRTWERYDRGMELSGYQHNVGYDFLSLRPALYAAGTGEVRFRNFKYHALP